ncbi:hypothetical protein MTsPCn3_10200 [Erythrobacter sp. MTPC3]
MNIHPQILIFAVSLAAIFALTGLAVMLRLGGQPLLSSSDDARRAASEVVDGFDPSRLAIAKSGDAAILQDSAGGVMVIKRHGNRFAGRILTAGAKADCDGDRMSIRTGERQFGTVTLEVNDAAAWADAINRLGSSGNA